MQIDNKDYIRLLIIPCYSKKDIMELADVGSTAAFEIMRVCKEKFNGSIKDRPQVITARSYWAYCGDDLGKTRREILGEAVKQLLI